MSVLTPGGYAPATLFMVATSQVLNQSSLVSFDNNPPGSYHKYDGRPPPNGRERCYFAVSGQSSAVNTGRMLDAGWKGSTGQPRLSDMDDINIWYDAYTAYLQ